MISTKDLKFSEYGQIPEQFYSFNLGFRVKRVEVSALFYGAAKFMTNLANAYSYGYMNDGVYSDLQENAWTAERYAAGEPITAKPEASKKMDTKTRTARVSGRIRRISYPWC